MIRFRFAYLLTLWCALSVSLGVADEQLVDYYHPANLLKFADALYEQGDYLRAAGEYQRYLFHKPEETERVLQRIALSYRRGGRPDRAVQYLENIRRKHPHSNLVQYELSAAFFLLEDYGRSLRLLTSNQGLSRDEIYRWKSEQLIGMNYLMQKRWNDASRHFHRLDSHAMPPNLRQTVLISKKYAENGKHLPRKSPILAGLFSAVIPGSGRVYAGRPYDALTTVTILGLTGWLAYDGFSTDGVSSTKGWVFGTIGGFFYLGNVYGSVVTAQVYNRRTETAFLTTISLEIP